jgi:hypothetical protein
MADNTGHEIISTGHWKVRAMPDVWRWLCGETVGTEGWHKYAFYTHFLTEPPNIPTFSPESPKWSIWQEAVFKYKYNTMGEVLNSSNSKCDYTVRIFRNWQKSDLFGAPFLRRLELLQLPYFSINNAHLMYNARPKHFRHSFWCIDNAHDAN